MRMLPCWILLTIALAAAAGCGQPVENKNNETESPAATALSRDEQVQVAVFERKLEGFKDIKNYKDAPGIYLAVCDNQLLFSEESTPRDPSDKVMQALESHGVKKFSDCVIDENIRRPVSKSDGSRGRILWIGPIKWIDDQTTEMNTGTYNGFNAQIGETFRVRREGDKWIITIICGVKT